MPILSYYEQLRDPRWQEKRLHVLNRAGFRCECCGEKPEGESLHIHHRYYQRGLMAWDYPDNALVCVCSGCHDELSEAEHLLITSIKPRDLSSIYDLAFILMKVGLLRPIVSNLKWYLWWKLFPGKKRPSRKSYLLQFERQTK